MFYKIEQNEAEYTLCIYDGADIDLLINDWRMRCREFPIFADWLVFHGHGEIIESVELRRIEL
jgi:hypothetical protein